VSTVTKNVEISMTRIVSVFVTVSKNPAIMGENKYFDDEANWTSPLALENCSSVNKSE